MEYINAKTIVRKCIPNRNYLSFEYAMDIYRGCSHGCIYCYARSSYYEKTDNFNCVRAKRDALRIIRDELSGMVRTGVVLMGGVSDSYNPKEKELKLTRNALELINAFNFGVCIITKSNLVTRDTDILLDIKEHSPASVNFSITCADDETCKKVEPFVSTTKERFEAIEYLTKNGITTGVLMDPMIPYITDTKENVQEMVKKAKNYGANYIYLSTQVTMADVQRDYFLHEAEKHFPGISEKFMQRYKNYYRCWSYNSKKLWHTFVEACEKESMNYDMRAVNQMARSGYSSILNILK
ncbi:radical SAM domain protein [Clostridiales bacterium oral taxon 876 str. F0540]|nr:radical SAM domain protein [Clostridiales bacterium oral taxon 876 str. F0540]